MILNGVSSWVSVAQEALALSVLSIATVYDVRWRIVPSKLAYAFVAGEATLLAARIAVEGLPRYWQLYAAIDALITIVVGVLVLLCLKGPGDFYMILGAVLSAPWGAPLLPASLALLLYYSVYSLTPMLYNLAANLASREARREAAKLPLLRRLHRLLTARPLPAHKLAEEGVWWIPLDLGEARRSVCSVDVEPWEVVRSAIREGRVRKDELLWATYGIPALLPLLAAYVTLLVLGDTPITLLLYTLLSPKG